MMTLALAASAGGERLLLCRPRILGDPALARAEAIGEAARQLGGRFLDYGVACEDPPESARAARRAGLAHAVSSAADGRAEGTRYLLVLADSESEAVRAQRTLEVAPGGDAVKPIRVALAELVGTLPAEPGPKTSHVAAWTVAGAGVAAIAAGVGLAFSAQDAADRANRASDPAAYTSARSEWDRKRKWSAVSLGVGTAALAAGLTWRFAF